MKALIVKKKYLDDIFDNGKVWEMRACRTNVTGVIGLIESGSGLIMGIANLIGCSAVPVSRDEKLIKYHKVENLELLDKWKWAWYIHGAKRFECPVPYKHPRGAVIWVNL